MEVKNLLLILLLMVTFQGAVPAKGKTRGEKLQEELAQLRSQFDQFRSDMNRKLAPLFKTPDDSGESEPLYKLIRIEAEQEILARLGQLENKTSAESDLGDRVQQLEDRVEQFHPPTVGEGDEEEGEVELGEDTGAEEEETVVDEEDADEDDRTEEQDGGDEDDDEEGWDEVISETEPNESTASPPTTKQPVLRVLSESEARKYTKVYTDNPSSGAFLIQRSNYAFSSALHKEIRKADGGAKNLAFSPLSLSLLLVAARSGSGGGTATQIDTALRLSSEHKKDPASVRAGFYKIIKAMERHKENYNVSVANKMYAQPSPVLRPSEEFQAVAKHILSTELELLDFSSDGRQTAVGVINSWAQSEIQGAAQPLVSADSLSANPQIVLVSTAHFNSPWLHPFQRQRTRKQVFHLSSSATTQVDMMSSSERYQFAELPKLMANLVILSFQGRYLQMHVYIPHAIDGLDAFLRAYEQNSPVIESMVKASLTATCALRLPKFKIESNLNLKEPLKQMGARDMFTETAADFGGLYVTDAVHKAFIEVNEDGSSSETTAAAAGGSGDCSGATVEVVADRPFYYHIFDFDSETVVFAGTVRNPNA